ncbi:PHB depolymerase family esterase [Cellulomonas sp. PhB150]|uniref:extracellular catalytic domain type 1 short-chain-length polyhydroxyalkanoate depolymerase n=1 Tax=Cellulomonas sp. PhB150 TaxID=2485188 RepID=UPI000F462837|nr:PHB depolymerase family esterase [Cellulomonas sp. PhB150]
MRSVALGVAAALAVVGVAGAASAGAAPPRQLASASCHAQLAAGTHAVPVRFQGRAYDVRVHVPADRPRRVPVVLDLHGSGADGAAQAAISGLDAVADENGFVVVEPTAAIALNGGWAWNVPGVPTTAGQLPPADARDDVAFLRAVIARVGAAVCADARRVYATGYSGGGRMASALACRLADRLAAVATVAGLRAGRPSPQDTSVPDVADCTPSRPVPVLEFHGDADYTNPYLGSTDLRWGYTVPVAVQTWARLDGCRVGPVTQQVSAHVTRYAYSRCEGRADVELYRVAGGGHTWPGTSVDQSSNGTVTQEIDASRLMWAFFADHPRR